ncbi:myosin G [Besnoitia besnoiti]|uniref:Myosin G n=1 Tax=Besnoitia besnoiti TaxID=94643 RepID=A0A2A9MB18_BESBE|nr:myosin G [Besnoitia besnoiti]PFH34394.1 myosin G [Besnoitia besnoiti]
MGDRWWVPHSTEVWGVAVAAADNNKYRLVEVTDEGTDRGNLSVTVPNSDLAKVAPITDSRSLEGIRNVCDLGDVSEASVLHTVRIRYQKDEIYTNVGRIVLALNPFKYLPLYGPDFVRDYFHAPHAFDLAPHLFQVAAAAVKGLSERGKPQSTLITGESGAGKTESTKLILQFLADVTQGREATSLQQRILEISPVLESFGNASTSRNPNSSRFGKWIEVYFAENLKVLGATITSYLLELPRVTRHITGERSYHVFYQLVHGLSTSDLVGVAEAYQLGTDPSAFSYLMPQEPVMTGKNATAEKTASHPPAHEVDDLAGFSELKRALLILGFTPSTQNAIFSIVAAILHLGNVAFDPDAAGEKCVVLGATRDHLATASELLGLDVSMVEGALTSRKMKTGNESILIPLKVDQAGAARDSFSKLVYGYLFNWLIAQINDSLAPCRGQIFDVNRYVGLLDIAGFESFRVNGFEQLCINLSNEELQHHFNADIFLNEISDYEKDGLKGVSITFEDNADVLQLIAGKGGIIATLDEEVFVPKGSDQGFLNKLNKAQANSKRFIQNKIQGSMSFGIRHYAGDVTYTVDGWLVKDQNAPPQEATDCLHTSKNAIVKAVLETALGLAGGGAGRGGKSTVGSVFKKQLNELMAKINGTDSHYVRCIKPNPFHKPRALHSAQILHQLVCSGVMEAIRIRKSGFALRLFHQDFVDRYRLVLGSKAAVDLRALDATDAARELVKQLIASKGVSSEECLVGRTKVFARSNVQDVLERAREEAMVEPVIHIQAVYRGFRTRQQCRVLFEVYGRLKEFLTAGEEAYKRGGYLTTNPIFPNAATPKHLQKKAILLGDLVSKLEALDPALQPGCLPSVSKYHMRMAAEAEVCLELERVLDLIERRVEENEANIPSMLQAALQKADKQKLSGIWIDAAARRLRQLESEAQLGDALDQALDAKDKAAMTRLLEDTKKLEAAATPPRLLTTYLASLVASAEAFLASDLREEERLKREREKAEASRKEAKERQQQEALLMDAVEERRRSERMSLISAASELFARRSMESMQAPRLHIEREVEAETASTSESDWTDSSEEESIDDFDAPYALDDEEGGESRAPSYYLRKFLREVARATRECDPAQIAFLLERAKEANLGKGPRELQLARVQLENLGDPAFLNSELKEAVVGVTWGVATQEDLLKLRNLVRQAQLFKGKTKQDHAYGRNAAPASYGGIDEKVLASAMATLESLRRIEGRERERDEKDEHIGSAGERGERGSARTAFPFEDYPKLQINIQIQETKSMRKAERLLFRREELLSHQSEPLAEPLLRPPDPHARALALNVFRSILGVMGDRFCVGRSALSEEILTLGRNADDLRDEIYCQVLKQLRNNPSAGNTLAGLRLLQACCQSFPPSARLEPYLRYSLHQYLSGVCATGGGGSGTGIKFQQDVEQICRHALRDLELTCDRKREEVGEYATQRTKRAIGGSEGSRQVQRLFVEGERPRDLCVDLVTELNLVGVDDWAIMEEISDYEVKKTTARGPPPAAFRLLRHDQPVQAYISQANAPVHLCLRRPVIRVDEALPLHPETAALIYRQAVTQYQQHVFNEDPILLSNISAHLLQVEGLLKLSAPRVPPWPSLSWSIPQRLHWLQSEAAWVASVSEAAAGLDPEEGDLLAMSAAFKLMQKLTGFGGSVWLADAFPLFVADLKRSARLHEVVKQTTPGAEVSLSALLETRRTPLALLQQWMPVLGDGEDRERIQRICSALSNRRKGTHRKKGEQSRATHASALSADLKGEAPPNGDQAHGQKKTSRRGQLWRTLLCRRVDHGSVGSNAVLSHVHRGQKRNPDDVYTLTGSWWIAVNQKGIHIATVFDDEGLAIASAPDPGAHAHVVSLEEKREEGREEGTRGRQHQKSQESSESRHTEERGEPGDLDGRGPPRKDVITNGARGGEAQDDKKGVFTIQPENLWLVAALDSRNDAPDRLLLGYDDPRTGKRRLEAFVSRVRNEYFGSSKHRV